MSRAHKLAAARRYIARQEQRYSLFAWAGTAVQEGLVEPSAEARVDRWEQHSQEILRQARVRTIHDYRAALAEVDPADRHQLIAEFKSQDEHPTPAALQRFLHPDPRQVEILARMRALHDEREREFAETGGRRMGNTLYDEAGRMLIFRRGEDGIERTIDGKYTRLQSGTVIEGLSDEEHARWRQEHREMIESVGGTV